MKIEIDLTDVDVNKALEIGNLIINSPDRDNDIEIELYDGERFRSTYLTLLQAQQLALYLLRCFANSLTHPTHDRRQK